MKNLQDEKPRVKEYLERVGVTSLRTIVITNWKGKQYRFVPEIELVIDLEKERRGVHMSRLIESIAECIEEEVAIRYNSLEELGRAILEKVKKKHPYKRGEISIKTQLVTPKETPITKKKTFETHDVEVRVYSDNGKYRKILIVRVIGNTLCPHSLENVNGKTHVQRAITELEIETSFEEEIALEDMISLVESCFPSEVYTLLKTKDEKYVVEKMFENPKFVEDVTRDVLDKARKIVAEGKIRVKTISFESIHRHDVLAEVSCRINGKSKNE